MNPHRPNILLLTTHDTGRHFGCFGVTGAPTPEIDRLASDGVRCTNHFATAPICSPSRASMTTGLYPQRHGVMGISTHPWHWPLNTPQRHLSHQLRNAGYATALFGIHHETEKPESLGFDFCPTTGRPTPPAPELAEIVGQFLTNRPNTPFFAQVGFFETHTPYDFGGAIPEDRGNLSLPPFLAEEDPARDRIASLHGSLRQLDRGIGKILNDLENLSLAENTIVVLTSDHGIELPRAKWYLYDPGLATALVVRWPNGNLSGGRICDALLSNVDLSPTLLDLVGLEPPGGSDGSSAAACWLGKTNQVRREIFGFQHGFESRCIRTDRWKLIRNFELRPEFRTPASISHPHLGHGQQAMLAELYDLEEDPMEFNNLVDSPTHREILLSLHETLHDWMRGLNDPILQAPLPTPFHTASRQWNPALARSSAHWPAISA